jgi:hypothetical protein
LTTDRQEQTLLAGLSPSWTAGLSHDALGHKILDVYRPSVLSTIRGQNTSTAHHQAEHLGPQLGEPAISSALEPRTINHQEQEQSSQLVQRKMQFKFGSKSFTSRSFTQPSFFLLPLGYPGPEPNCATRLPLNITYTFPLPSVRVGGGWELVRVFGGKSRPNGSLGLLLSSFFATSFSCPLPSSFRRDRLPSWRLLVFFLPPPIIYCSLFNSPCIQGDGIFCGVQTDSRVQHPVFFLLGLSHSSLG